MSTDGVSKKEVSELILKVLTNQATPDESVILDEWVKKSDNNRRFFLHFRNGWLASSQVISSDSTRTAKALELINQRVNSTHSAENNQPDLKLLPGSRSSFLRYLRIAALWLLLIGLGSIFSLIILKPVGFLSSKSQVSVIAPRGSKALTILPDGTEIWINAGSRISYKIPHGKPAREVTLEGEAYFNVEKDPDNPFTVNAGEMIVKAYGTEFNVKAYPEEKEIETTLVKGSVSVEIKSKPSNKTLLKPREQAIYFEATSERSENFLVTKGIDPSFYTLWINDRLQLRGETLENLAVMLERKYDVTIHFDNTSLRDLRFTGVIENETIEQILELIKISSNIDYRIDGREIWLTRTGTRIK